MIDRFFLDQTFEKGAALLMGSEFKHFRVMRIKEGEAITLVNGRCEIATADVTAMNKDHAELLIKKIYKKEVPEVKSILALGLMKQSHLELAIEKGTEIGIDTFYLFPAKRSEKKVLKKSQEERLKNITISALKQCGRPHLPKIFFYHSLSALSSFSGEVFYGDLSPEALFQTRNPTSSSLFFVGPEKGFASSEIEKMQKDFKAKGISLGKNVLRAETAAIAASFYLLNY